LNDSGPAAKERLVLLVLSDFDPNGEEIAHSFVRSLRDDFGLNENDIEPIRVALTTAQIREFELVPVMSLKPRTFFDEAASKNYHSHKHSVRNSVLLIIHSGNYSSRDRPVCCFCFVP
jgi:hypothetical protein